MISYTFDQDILYITFTGEIKLEDIIEYLKEFDNLDSLPKNLHLLYDLVNAKLNIAPTEIKIISQIADISTHEYSSTKTAFLVDNPKVTAYSTLFSNVTTNPKTQRKIFSTKEAAIKWLKDSHK
jgi:hypothetical protein